MKVLVVDRNNYYGGESASLNLTNLYKKFRGSDPPPAVRCGRLDFAFTSAVNNPGLSLFAGARLLL